MNNQKDGPATEELSSAQRRTQYTESKRASSASSGYYSITSQYSLDSVEDKKEPQNGFTSDEVIEEVEDSVMCRIASRTKPDCDSQPMRFYAKGPEKRVLCIQREDVRLLAATGEHDPSRQSEFVLADENLVNDGNIEGTKAKLRTVNGTLIGVCISDPRHPENAELKTLNGTADKSLNPLVEAIIYEDVIKPRTMICYPNGKTYYYIVPSSDSTSITVIPDEPPTYPVKENYMCWTHVPSCT